MSNIIGDIFTIIGAVISFCIVCIGIEGWLEGDKTKLSRNAFLWISGIVLGILFLCNSTVELRQTMRQTTAEQSEGVCESLPEELVINGNRYILAEEIEE